MDHTLDGKKQINQRNSFGCVAKNVESRVNIVNEEEHEG